MMAMMPATPMVLAAPAVLLPEWISQIEFARVGDRSDHPAGDSANDQTGTHTTACGAGDQRAAPRADETTTDRPVFGGRSAARQHC